MKLDLDRMSILRWLFPGRSAAAQVARRWTRALERDPELAIDLIHLGGLLEIRNRDQPPDPAALAEDRGRADLARTLLTLGSVTPSDFAKLMEIETDV